MAYTVPNPNVLLALSEDKLGHMLVEIKNQLVATGLFRVRGSGDGVSVQLMGQTAGVAGSFDVFTASPAWLPLVNYNQAPWWATGPAGSMSRGSAWFVLEELSSGRAFAFQRAGSSVDSPGTFTIKIGTAGCASSGATSTVMPAMLGVAGLWNMTLGGTATYNQPSGSGNQLWLQLGRADVADSNGVSPFWLAVWNRTLNAPVWGMLHESLDMVPTGASQFVFGAGDWASNTMFGALFNGTGYLYSPTAAAFPGVRLTGLSVNGVQKPATAANDPQPIGIDNRWRAIRPPVNDSGGAWLGRCKNILAHPINRAYPTTYDIATDPRVALGQILVPWTSSAAPQSSP